MYALTRSNYFRQWRFLHHKRELLKPKAEISEKERISRELRTAGVSIYALLKEEARYLPSIMYPGEHIGGVVYGHSKGSSVMLIATDRRVIFLDKKPLFVEEDEARYRVVSGVDISTNGIGATVTLHTKIKDYKVRTLNMFSARKFVGFIERKCMQQPKNKQGENYD